MQKKENDYRKKSEYQKGLQNFHDKYDKSHANIIDQLYGFSPELADVIFSHGLYDIWEVKTPSLSIPQKEIAVFASLVTAGTTPSEIKAHAQNLLNVGISKQQIKELMVLLTLYIGVPKIVSARRCVVEAFEEHDAEKNN